MPSERRLAAIMFTDIADYTKMAQADEAAALELLREHRAILRPCFLKHGGTEVKTMGDGFLVEFRSALDAVQCAVDAQARIRQRNAAAAPSRRLELRIGVHVGDVVSEGGDISGDAVNVASRIEPVAAPGEVCISQQVYDQVRNKGGLAFVKVGELELKHLDLPMAVYKVVQGPGEPSVVAPGPRERIGVLPFVNISPDPNDEYFADGLTEELISRLSEVKEFKVIARTSVMGYKGKDKKVSEIARELGAGSIVEGSVRKAGNRVRVTVQLIDPGTEEHLWSSNYDAGLDDIFAIQSDVATKVANSLSAELSRGPLRETGDVEAYSLYLRAKQLSYDTSDKALHETVSLLQRAIAKEPGFARAYALLSEAWHMLSVTAYVNFSDAVPKSEVAARKALELDPGLAEAHSAMAAVHWLNDRFDDALQEAEAAIRINPSLAHAYMTLGVLYSMRSPWESLQMFRKGYELDPLSPGTGEQLASAALWVGERKEAREVLARLMELNPENARLYLVVADYYMDLKDYPEAQKMIDLARSISPSEPILATSQGLLYAKEGKVEEARAALREIEKNPSESFRLNGKLWIDAALGDLDGAFEALMRQAEQHSWPASINVDPLYEGMRKDPRFAVFSQKVGMWS